MADLNPRRLGQSKGAQFIWNVPAPPTPLIGRQGEVDTVLRQLRRTDVRLLTLTGPPGVGKTRLALEVATLIRGEFEDGVVFADLSPIADADLVVSTIAKSIAMSEGPGQPLVDQVKDVLLNRRLLLVLDNFEQVIAAGSLLATLLSACPMLKFLVTSRRALHVRWEHEFEVPPLYLPNIRRPSSPEELADNPAVAFFVNRASAVKPDFTLNAQNGKAVSEICLRLDGLPLAIELAAAQSKVFPPHILLMGLQQRLGSLTEGLQDQPERHHSLRAAIAWSYRLLARQDQVLFNRLGVFTGGCTVEAANSVGNDSGDSSIDLMFRMASLVNASLVRQGVGPEGEPRFKMLETIREYALEQLAESGELERIRSRHAAYYSTLAEKAKEEQRGPHRGVWVSRLEAERDNLRAALAWDEENEERTEHALRLAADLVWFWDASGPYGEGRIHLENLLSQPRVSSRTVMRARALQAAGALAWRQGDYASAHSLTQEGLSIYRQLQDKRGVGFCLGQLGGIAVKQAEYGAAKPLLAESLAIFQELNDKVHAVIALNSLALISINQCDYVAAQLLLEEGLATCREVDYARGVSIYLHNMGVMERDQGNFDKARSIFEESLKIRQEMGDKRGIAKALVGLGMVARHRHEYVKAQALLTEGLTIGRDVGEGETIGVALHELALIAHGRGDFVRAVDLMRESLMTIRSVGDKRDIAEALEHFAQLAAALGQPVRVARLFGAAKVLRESIGAPVPPVDRADYERGLTIARTRLSEDAFAAAWAAGRAMPLGEAIEYARTLEESERAEKSPRKRGPSGYRQGPLTGREFEVARLVAQGLTNREIAHTLVVSERTAANHVQHILNRLGFRSRSQIAVWAEAQREHPSQSH